MASYKEERRHSGHYIGMTEDISDTTEGRQKTITTQHKEERRHSGHYIGMTEDISDTTQGRQKTFRTPYKEERIIADIPDHPKASTRRPATAKHISHSAA